MAESERQTLTLHAAELFPLARELMAKSSGGRFTVSGNSMWPLIHHNRDSVLLCPPLSPAKPGDIVLLETFPGSGYILHRVMKVSAGQLITAGDGCLSFDAPAPQSQVIGIVSHVYRSRLIIRCKAPFWRFIFWVWRVSFPLRPAMLRALRALARARGALKRSPR